jgi:hypothetical protein
LARLVGERYGSNSYGASETAQENTSRNNRLFEFFLSRPRPSWPTLRLIRRPPARTVSLNWWPERGVTALRNSPRGKPFRSEVVVANAFYKLKKVRTIILAGAPGFEPGLRYCAQGSGKNATVFQSCVPSDTNF